MQRWKLTSKPKACCSTRPILLLSVTHCAKRASTPNGKESSATRLGGSSRSLLVNWPEPGCRIDSEPSDRKSSPPKRTSSEGPSPILFGRLQEFLQNRLDRNADRVQPSNEAPRPDRASRITHHARNASRLNPVLLKRDL